MHVIRQGELYLFELESLTTDEFDDLKRLNPELERDVPAGFSEAAREDGALVCAHSETGHHHVVDAPRARRFVSPSDPLVAYLVLGMEAELKHRREDHTHESHTLAKGIYYARLQRESTPDGWQRVRD